jgi:uncharacterized membrane protein YcgQ (UPF0703/DUF1980 family)
MAVLLIIDEGSQLIEQVIQCDVLYITAHKSFEHARVDLNQKQFDFILHRFRPDLVDRKTLVDSVKAKQPDVRFIWLVEQAYNEDFQKLTEFREDLSIVGELSAHKVLSTIGGELVNQDEVDQLFSKERKE